MAKVSVREISRVTGFSPATVSNALNHKRSVSEETARIIQEAAEKLGYQQPSQFDAIQFVLARKNGRIIDESTFHPAVIEGVERQARRYGLRTSFVSLDLSDHEACSAQIEQLVSDPAAAIVLLGTEMDEDDFDLFANARSNIMLLDSWSQRHDFDAVLIANEDSALRAVRYLAAHGHRHIGYLAGDFRIHNFCAREQGYYQAMSELGMEGDPAPTVMLGTTLETAYHDMAEWFAREGRKALPTAFFADNDVLAVGAMRALNEAGIRVPEDVSIIGFDDLSLGSFSNPPLTTVHVPKHEVGEIAVRRLIGKIREPKRFTCKTQLSTYFVERQSVKTL